MTSTFVTLETSEGTKFVVDQKIAKMSVLIKNMLEDVGDDTDNAIPLPNVSGPTFQRMLQFCEEHKDDVAGKDAVACTVDDDKNEIKLTPWDKTFFADMSREDFFAVLIAANYLDMPLLLHTACQASANELKGKSVEFIRDYFGMTCDFTPEEEEQIRRENAWCSE